MMFPLKFRATIRRAVKTVEKSGQASPTSYTTIEEGAACLFLTTSGGRTMQGFTDFNTVNSFYLNPLVDVREGDIITNIRMINGTIIEAGPFAIDSVKHVVNPISGRVHHCSCKLKGVA